MGILYYPGPILGRPYVPGPWEVGLFQSLHAMAAISGFLFTVCLGQEFNAPPLAVVDLSLPSA